MADSDRRAADDLSGPGGPNDPGDAKPAGDAPAPVAPSRVAALRALAERAAELDYFQALRRIEVAHRDKPRLGTAARPSEEPLRIGQEPTVAFAPNAVSALSVEADGGLARMTVTFQGLFGPHGPLPLHLTEHARSRLRNHGDPTLVRFADVFHHRMLLLFYRAWAQAQPTVSFDRPADDQFATYIGAFTGTADPTTRGRDALPDTLRLYYAGLFGAQAKSRDGLRAVLADAFGVRTEIEEFVGEWVSVPETSRWRLGRTRQPGTLGASTTIGGRAWLCQHKFRIVIGPLTDAEREAFKRGTPRFRALSDLVQAYVGDELRWDLKLLVREATVVRLGQAGHLGWSAFLGPRERASVAGEILVDPRAQQGAGGA